MPDMEMPKYRCHKEVHALKIKQVYTDRSGGTSNVLQFENERYAPIEVDLEYVNKHIPEAGGYYVVYKDGYKSFSPADAFEEGYTLIPSTVSGSPG